MDCWLGLASALLIPSFAIALGVWSGTSKPFEAIYTVWWYLGPLNHAPGLDFVEGPSPAANQTIYYLAFTAALLAAAYGGRRARMAYA